MLDYLKPKKMLTELSFADNNSAQSSPLKVSYDNFYIGIKDELLVFSYDAIVNQRLSHESSISMSFEDDESYFVFILMNLDIDRSDFIYTKNPYLFAASVLFLDPALQVAAKQEYVQEPVKHNETPIEQAKPVKKVQAVASTKMKEQTLQEGILKRSMQKLRELFASIKDEKNPMTYLVLLFFAFVYGVIHAMGPGHGKTLVASYFLSNDRSYVKAFSISLAIGVVHTFSAFILTIVIYFFINQLLAQVLDDAVFYTTKVSALIIIAIAVYLIVKKYKARKVMQQQLNTALYDGETGLHASSCGCGSCKVDKTSTDIALIISAGIIPCPGTTTLFIFAISTGLYYAGFISAFVMSLGMSSVIFVSALFSTFVRMRLGGVSVKAKYYLEYFSLSLIFLLGFLLLLF